MVLLVALGACTSRSVDVALVGDSIGNQVAPLLQDDSDHRWTFAVQDGRRAVGMVEEAEVVAGSAITEAVVELGTNDVLQQVPVPETTAALGRIVDALAGGGARCIHLVTVSTLLPTFGRQPAADDAAQQLNDWMRRTADERDDVALVDWDGELRDAGGTDLLESDRIHPNAEGTALLRELLDAAPGSC